LLKVFAKMGQGSDLSVKFCRATAFLHGLFSYFLLSLPQVLPSGILLADRLHVWRRRVR